MSWSSGCPAAGVPVAVEVARALRAPLDVILVRKLGVPAQPELGLGAIGGIGGRASSTRTWCVTPMSARRRSPRSSRRNVPNCSGARSGFRGGDAPHVSLAGRIAVIVDDGIATGSTARAACQVARALGAAAVVLAVPVAPPSTDRALRGDA